MSRTSIRNKHGDLTVHALSQGYPEVRAWGASGVRHVVTMTQHPNRVGYRIAHTVNAATGPVTDIGAVLYFPSIRAARAEFKRRSRH